MSDLTPDGIVDYPLRTGVRGYRVDQVDELLDHVADRVEELERQLGERDAELARLRTHVDEAAAAEERVGRTLVTAQQAAEQTRTDAEQEAERIVAAARDEAEQVLGRARRQVEELHEEAARDADGIQADAVAARRDAELRVTQLTGAIERLRGQLQDQLDAHQALLDQMPASPAPEPEPDEDRADEAVSPAEPATAGPLPSRTLFATAPREPDDNSPGNGDDD